MRDDEPVAYDKAATGLLVIDPYNDFISPGGKVWDRQRGRRRSLGRAGQGVDVVAAGGPGRRIRGGREGDRQLRFAGGDRLRHQIGVVQPAVKGVAARLEPRARGHAVHRDVRRLKAARLIRRAPQQNAVVAGIKLDMEGDRAAVLRTEPTTGRVSSVPSYSLTNS